MSEPTAPDSEQHRAPCVPVIEQAKGVIMAQCRCEPEEAFAILCGMSQHANVKLRILAVRVIQQVSSLAPDDDLANPGGRVLGRVGSRGSLGPRQPPRASAGLQ